MQTFETCPDWEATQRRRQEFLTRSFIQADPIVPKPIDISASLAETDQAGCDEVASS